MNSTFRVAHAEWFARRGQKTNGALTASGVEPEPADPCRAALFYEDSRTRAWLLRYAGALRYQFEGDVEFEFAWWSIRFLRDSVLAEVAASEAAQADILVFAERGDTQVPEELRAFNERWLAQRGFREGFLMALTQNSERTLRGRSAWPAYLHDVAARARMEFATEFLSASAAEDAGSMEGLAQRAQRITPTLYQMLERSRPPSQWGINE